MASLVLAFSITPINNISFFPWALLMFFLVISINTIAKKLTGFYYESEVEVGFWEISRYGFKPKQHFKKPVPIGAFLPLVFKAVLFPIKNFAWMASLVFDVKPGIHKVSKRHGFYSFSETTEFQIGLIAASGIAANLLFSLIGYLLNFPDFARINIYYAFFNMLPLSGLDGNKIIFGNITLWSFLASLVIIGMFFAIFII